MFQHICQQSQLLISTDGSRTHNKSGDSWIIDLPDGTKLVSGHNPEFKRHVDINSYHSEIYGSLASLNFLECYCDYFSLPLHNIIHVSCDNKSYVTKLKEFISHPYSKLFIHKIKESEAYLTILFFLPVNFAINYIKGYQDEIKPSQDLIIAEQLNVDADKIATTCATMSINIHLPSAPFAIYVKGEYIHLLPHKRIWEVSYEDEARQFLQTKYKWKSLTIHDIDWKLHLTQFNKLPPSRKRSVARFIHHRLPYGNMMFEYKHRCPFCAMSLDANTSHDHYLTCAFTRVSKTKRFTSFILKLDKLHTPLFLRDTIIHAINRY